MRTYRKIKFDRSLVEYDAYCYGVEVSETTKKYIWFGKETSNIIGYLGSDGNTWNDYFFVAKYCAHSEKVADMLIDIKLNGLRYDYELV